MYKLVAPFPHGSYQDHSRGWGKSGSFHPISLRHLLKIILGEYDNNKSIFGIPEELFFVPDKNKHLNTSLFGQKLHSPLGVAAGPHSQMAQNIVVAWLMGARYIELKTVQTLDEIEVPKPCIDMQDEGYNCEWSQELTIKESFSEYLNSWIIIHILNHRFGREEEIGTIFNMSVGYNMQGIKNHNVQWFLEKMLSCAPELSSKISGIRDVYPEVDEIKISSRISDNITLSTMHGCPAEEIEEIAGYLIEERNLHTFVKLNPTLLGPVALREILNQKLGFKTIVPDSAFSHDLKYADSVRIIKSLQKKAKEKDLSFGLKLTNTLESVNSRNVFNSDVGMMYMSGRPLHPISVNLAKKLQQDFKGGLLISFSAGADAFNISDILSCGFKTITVCSDLLKPGGYMRLNQYFKNLGDSFRDCSSGNIEDFLISSSGNDNLNDAAFSNLFRYSGDVLKSRLYKREYLRTPDIKTNSELGYFDCISAPCRDACATNQDIPEYLYFTSANQVEKAFEVILRTNPFPSITGMVCDHLCQNKCTRINYDDPLQIREVKLFISEQDEIKLKPADKNGIKVAVIGAGPSGISCAYYLALAGFSAEVFEARSRSGGMVQFVIPGFRLTERSVNKDFKRVDELGVAIHYNTKIDSAKFQKLRKDFSYLFIAAGAQISSPLIIDGIDAKGVIEPLRFLNNVREGKQTGIGSNIVIIGAGNSAIDAARTAFRLAGEKGTVTIVYRRTINEMPADHGEIKAVLDEGVNIIELASPLKIIQENGKVKALICIRMKLMGKDSEERPLPVRIENSEFEIACDTIIPAIGQKPDLDFAGNIFSADKGEYSTGISNVFIGGDALRGASTAINAIGDGRKVAEQIIRSSGIDFTIKRTAKDKSFTKKELIIKRSNRLFAEKPSELALNDRRNFRLVTETLSRSAIIKEADRCLYCDELCNICTTVCPNFANFSYDITPVRYILQKAVFIGNGEVEFQYDKVFEVTQKYQILNIADFCNECGNCSTFCPTESAPYKEKPGFYLTISSFNEAEKGYYLSRSENRKKLIFKNRGKTETLTEQPEGYIYETEDITASISGSGFRLLEVIFKTTVIKEATFDHAAAMSILLGTADKLVFE